jgi:predicted type IV restriction endonuclease
MLQVLQARELTLHDVKQQFNLQQETDPAFFSEWKTAAPALSIHEQYVLDKAKADFMYLDEYPLHEELVKLVILSPLLSVAGFYSRPFCPIAEQQIEIEVAVDEDTDQLIRGRIDLLVLNDQLWVTLIEAKNKRFGVREAIPQALLYMLSEPKSSRSVSYGLATNGSEFLFLKLVKDEQPKYGFSRLFSLFNPGNELEDVVGILQGFGQLSTIGAD